MDNGRIAEPRPSKRQALPRLENVQPNIPLSLGLQTALRPSSLHHVRWSALSGTMATAQSPGHRERTHEHANRARCRRSRAAKFTVPRRCNLLTRRHSFHAVLRILGENRPRSAGETAQEPRCLVAAHQPTPELAKGRPHRPSTVKHRNDRRGDRATLPSTKRLTQASNLIGGHAPVVARHWEKSARHEGQGSNVRDAEG